MRNNRLKAMRTIGWMKNTWLAKRKDSRLPKSHLQGECQDKFHQHHRPDGKQAVKHLNATVEPDAIQNASRSRNRGKIRAISQKHIAMHRNEHGHKRENSLLLFCLRHKETPFRDKKRRPRILNRFYP